MIAGAQKSGTTSLLRYLGQHPALQAQGPIEAGFLADPEWQRGWAWARERYFYEAEGRQLLIGKYAPLYAEEHFVARLAQLSPDALVVMILRDPVDRAFSSYRMERNGGWVVQPFHAILERLDADPTDIWKRLFVDYGDYAAAYDRLLAHFPPARIRTLIYDEFVADPVAACRQVFRDLGVDDAFSPVTDTVYNAHHLVRSEAAATGLRWLRGADNPVRLAARRLLPPDVFDRIGRRLVEANHGLYSAETVDPEVREALGRYFRPRNQRLEEMIGRDLSRWTGMSA